MTDTLPEGATHSVAGQLENAAYLGERSHYYVTVAGNLTPVAVSSQNRDRATSGAEPGRPVWLSWDADAIVVLGAD